MRFFNVFLNTGGLIGVLIMVMGFILTPFIIGIPILILGMVIAVYYFHKRWTEVFVPKNIRIKVGKEIKESYKPYSPAIQSMKLIGKDIVKTSLIAFVVIIIAISVIIALFVVGGPEDTWICDKNGAWIKHGNPLYPGPVVPCINRIPLPKNKDDCLSQGGVWEKQGPEPFETCNRKAVDRGNLCRDNSECEGQCQVELTDKEKSLGMRGRLNIKKEFGQCSVWVVELGCNGIMKQGKAQVICVD